jgi:Bacterial Ig domain
MFLRHCLKLGPLLAGAALAIAGCGEPPGADGPDVGSTPAAAGSMEGDLVVATGPGVAAESALPVTAENATASPKVIYLIYADGKTPIPSMNYNACSGQAPKFQCSFGTSLLDCQQQIQAYLDRWYADFNVIFTLTRPTSGSYYTEVVSSGGGAWCNVDKTVAGVAPFLCQDLHGGVAYTLAGGENAHDTAVIIAQEQAHLLGLEHVSDDNDIMYPYICRNCDGFENKSVAVTGDRCDRQTQNSYQMMKNALGAWPGGNKPSAFGCMQDKDPPSLSFLSPKNGASMGHDFAVKLDAHDDCGLASVTLAVSPQGLTASTKNGPYEWDLTGIKGQQTITATATDSSGHTTTAILQITAPTDGDVTDPTAANATGCTVASGAFGAAGLIPSLSMLLVFAGRARRSGSRRRRWVPGALAPDRRS